ncbi:MAG: ketoacyl-ACP synthase III [Candidatus Thermoplasmatota archaeon]|nr:ketoacyl-ACP synthase III [Candidatus Thermoplasmatota archaeon]
MLEDQLSTSRFESVGVNVPSRSLTTTDLMRSMKHRIGLDLERLTGIHARRVCAPGESSYTLALNSARDCLSHSRYKPDDLEVIINCSISRSKDRNMIVYEPSMAHYIRQAIGAKNAMVFDINNACAGMLTGVQILNGYIRNGIFKNGMVVSGEHITPISDSATRTVRSIASRQLASLTVGDAGAAVILEKTGDRGNGMSVTQFTTLSKFSRLCIGKPLTNDIGGMMVAKARKIHRVALDHAPQLIKGALIKAGLTIDRIDHLIPHQTSKSSIKKGIKEMADHFKATPKNVVINLMEYGNTASTTVFLALHDMLKGGIVKKGEKIMLLCFASGLVVGVIIFTMDDLVDRYGISN